MKEKRKKAKRISELSEEILEKTGPDKKISERVFNYKVVSEELREIEVKGIFFMAKFYKTSSNTSGIRVSLVGNGPLFSKFYDYCLEIKGERIEKEKEVNLIAFTTFGKLDPGLEFFPIMGFYVFPFGVKGKEAHLVFNEEKDAPSPEERLEAFIDYYRKKFGLKVKPKKSGLEQLSSLDLTEI